MTRSIVSGQRATRASPLLIASSSCRLAVFLLDSSTLPLHPAPSALDQHALTQTVQVDGHEHDDAGDHQLLRGVDVHQPQPLAGHAQDEHAEHGAEKISDTSGKA